MHRGSGNGHRTTLQRVRRAMLTTSQLRELLEMAEADPELGSSQDFQNLVRVGRLRGYTRCCKSFETRSWNTRPRPLGRMRDRHPCTPCFRRSSRPAAA